MTLNSKDIDKLYHEMRVFCNKNTSYSGENILNLASHLLQMGGDYRGLVEFSNWYNTTFTLPKLAKILEPMDEYFTHIIDLGAGKGWLGKGLQAALNIDTRISVDKRQWDNTYLVADLETPQGKQELKNHLHPKTMIVMCDFVHCVDHKTLEFILGLPVDAFVILEYIPGSPEYRASYVKQLEKFGAAAYPSLEVFAQDLGIARASYNLDFDLDPYACAVISIEGPIIYG